MGCEKCNPIIMTRQGCCTGATGRAEGLGVRKAVVRETGETFEICGALRKDDKGWFCGIYETRPQICRIFDCDRSIRSRIKG